MPSTSSSPLFLGHFTSNLSVVYRNLHRVPITSRDPRDHRYHYYFKSFLLILFVSREVLSPCGF